VAGNQSIVGVTVGVTVAGALVGVGVTTVGLHADITIITNQVTKDMVNNFTPVL
jgi:hypothetical protein